MDINDGNAGIRVIDSNLKCRLDDIGNALVIHVSIRVEAKLFGSPRAPERHPPPLPDIEPDMVEAEAAQVWTALG